MNALMAFRHAYHSHQLLSLVTRQPSLLHHDLKKVTGKGYPIQQIQAS
jgi:hypothetical protein